MVTTPARVPASARRRSQGGPVEQCQPVFRGDLGEPSPANLLLPVVDDQEGLTPSSRFLFVRYADFGDTLTNRGREVERGPTKSASAPPRRASWLESIPRRSRGAQTSAGALAASPPCRRQRDTDHHGLVGGRAVAGILAGSGSVSEPDETAGTGRVTPDAGPSGNGHVCVPRPAGRAAAVRGGYRAVDYSALRRL